MNRFAIILLLLPSCAAPTAAERSAIYARNIDVSRATCLVMLADAQATVSDEQKAQCLVVLRGCPKP